MQFIFNLIRIEETKMSITNRLLNRLCAVVNGSRLGCSADSLHVQVRTRKYFAHDRILQTNISDKFKVMKRELLVCFVQKN
jgi:hypothetical protein